MEIYESDYGLNCLGSEVREYKNTQEKLDKLVECLKIFFEPEINEHKKNMNPL